MSITDKIKLAVIGNKIASKLDIGYIDRIKLALGVKKMAEVKSGWKSTEFLFTAISLLGTVGGMFIGKISPDQMVKIVSFLVPGYAIARAITKMTKTTKDDELLAAVEKNILSKFGINLSTENAKVPEEMTKSK